TVNEQDFTDLRIYADGFVASPASFAPANFPNKCFANQISPTYSVAGWWSNLELGVDSALSTFQSDEDHFVIEYDKFISAGSDPHETVTFQIILDADGQAQFNYAQLPSEAPEDLTVGASIDDG